MDNLTYSQKYYQENKERWSKYRQDEKYKQTQKESRQKYYQKNKEKLKEKAKEYRQNNSEKIKEYDRLRAERDGQRKQTQRNRFVTRWKSAGIKCDDWDKLVDKYMSITHCETCNCELVKYTMSGSNRLCLEHCHTSGYVRSLSCHTCNMKIAKVDKFKKEVLLNLHRKFNSL